MLVSRWTAGYLWTDHTCFAFVLERKGEPCSTLFRPRCGPTGPRCRCAGLSLRAVGSAHPAHPSENKLSKQAPAPAAPTARYDAFTVREFEVLGEKKSDWSRIGAAWPHQDGQGLRLILQAVPVDGVVILRKHEPKPTE